jgi:hypothetical protein
MLSSYDITIILIKQVKTSMTEHYEAVRIRETVSTRTSADSFIMQIMIGIVIRSNLWG